MAEEEIMRADPAVRRFDSGGLQCGADFGMTGTFSNF